MTDAVNAFNSNLSRDDLVKLVEPEEKVDMILDVIEDVKRFRYYEMAKDMGIVYGKNDLSFTDMILFSWIRGVKKSG